ncbi:hypothetical protein [Lactococcus sp. dk322]|uniref:hypothetical protein n=1 Tax=Lactococcus sp. dk322 TaxID=2603290 RepID=UPI0011C8E097|nr:hypothetical protein [Lactococcus sp. dk322]TXK46786.1 hypothetical protein FVP43_10850 [Lactococcus sp. dk322]
MKKEKFWNRKKTGISVLSFLVLGGIGLFFAVHNNSDVRETSSKKIYDKKKSDRKYKTLKEKEAKSEFILTESVMSATREPTSENIKKVQAAITNVKNENKVKAANKELKAIQNRLNLINRAKKAISAYQADTLNDTKKEKAQQALKKLTDDDKVIRTSLQEKID